MYILNKGIAIKVYFKGTELNINKGIVYILYVVNTNKSEYK